ncbi:MAG: cobyric acid synthase CobQ, partial [Pseudomonadota bacterium]
LAFLRAQGWDIDLTAHMRRGGHVLGICGGYQMLGRTIADPEGIEGAPGTDPGLGLLDVDTVMIPDKRLTQVSATHAATGKPFHGYEIHIGRTDGPDRARPFGYVDGAGEGAASSGGRIQGSYLHGMFADDAFRAAWLEGFGAKSENPYNDSVDAALETLADHVEAHLDVDGLLAAAR